MTTRVDMLLNPNTISQCRITRKSHLGLAKAGLNSRVVLFSSGLNSEILLYV